MGASPTRCNEASSSSGSIDIWAASSASVGIRCRRVDSSTVAFSISRASPRTLRGTQSSERSPSKIAPRIRVPA